MGSLGSKVENPLELKADVDRVKSCLENHQGNVYSIDSAVNAQTQSVQVLSQMVSDFRGMPESECEQPKNEVLEKAQNLLADIQNTLIHQGRALNSSFRILDNCIHEITKKYSPESCSSVDTEKPVLVSLKAMKPKGVSDMVTYESENQEIFHDEGSVAKPPQDDFDNSAIAIREENKINIFKNQELQKKLRESQGKTDQLQEENRHQREDIERLEYRLKLKTDELHRLQDDQGHLHRECEKLETEKENLKGQVREMNKKANARYSLETELRRSQDLNRSLQHKIDGLESEKRKMMERKVNVSVQLYYQRRGELMTMVVEELSAMLITQMQMKNIQLDIVRCENSSNIRPDKPILVLCINSSRLGTDAATAIEGLHKSGRTALLIFHHKNVHALPNQPSDRMLTSFEFKPLGGIFDLAFLSGKGIYPCDMNNSAMSNIETFLKQNNAST